MKKHKHILIAIIIGTQTLSVANGVGLVGTIEGEPVFSKDTGGRFTVIVRRQADKLQVKPSLFNMLGVKRVNASLVLNWNLKISK